MLLSTSHFFYLTSNAPSSVHFNSNEEKMSQANPIILLSSTERGISFNDIGKISSRKECTSFEILSFHFTLSMPEHAKIPTFLEKFPTSHCELGNRETVIFY